MIKIMLTKTVLNKEVLYFLMVFVCKYIQVYAGCPFCRIWISLC
jgi:hypothetical protein